MTVSDFDPEGDADATVSSPCVSICKLNNEGVCSGCFRSRDEITHWTTYHNAEKADVLEKCRDRKRECQPSQKAR